MTTPFDLGDKVAIVTGSSRGIGRASAEAMARLGAKVVVSSHKADACEAVARGIRESGGEAAVVSCNISQSAMPVIGFPHLTSLETRPDYLTSFHRGLGEIGISKAKT